MRQLSDSEGAVTLAQSFEPYGESLGAFGNQATSYGFAGEQTDATGLVYLRARYYAPDQGRFITADPQMGDYDSPLSLNEWLYVQGNPINLTDPSGKVPMGPENACIRSAQLIGVNQLVKIDVCAMIATLEHSGFMKDMVDQDHINDGYRTKREAHRYSTAFHILHGYVSVEDLQANPVDLDGNTWYREDWGLIVSCPPVFLEMLLSHRIKKNASELSPETQSQGIFPSLVFTGLGFVRNLSYATEGYSSNSPFRLPNSDQPVVSKHALGLAVDISYGWITTNNPRIDDIARRYGLIRAYNNKFIGYAGITTQEWWHFER